ncbi:hypothetical protein M2454_002545 [Aequitasia blattaphilus]|uniref:ABC transporter permease n=1 Tax=Aequitasia blattaphilus TaxID=2949332 RepID=A0ABT1ECA3_9FIRM|nr:hypothetical protein [Aequitasia blattaphilus]MCP1103471.1 hypothetical protein [Aequitasia blattaphilus]MCR8616111.1 hypothetical protein [Aequitasia blattaphilus]
MLGKLIKYDFKAISIPLLILHSALLLFTIFSRFFVFNHIDYSENNPLSLFTFLFVLLFYIGNIAISLGTYVIIALRFYKHLFTEKGYLARTLPVSSLSHLLSKTIVGIVWGFVNTILITFCTAFVIFTPSFFKATNLIGGMNVFFQVFGFHNSFQVAFFLIATVILTLLSVICSIALIYLAIALGSLFSNHKILASIAFYFVLNFAYSMISSIVMLPLFVKSTSTFESIRNLPHLLFSTYGILSIVIIILSTLSYFVIHYLMDKKIDL